MTATSPAAALPDRDATRPLIATRPVAITGDVTFLPSEDVLLLSVTLPAMSAAQRRIATGFAIEDDLAQPLDQVHVVPGPQMPDGRWLVAVVSRQVLAGVAVPQGHRLLPDVLAVPVPEAGWAVLGQPGRVLVRLPDGTGLATDFAGAAALWTMSGSPPLHSCGGPLPDELAVTDMLPLPAGPDPTLARFDLMAGIRPGGGVRLPRGARLAIAVLSAFLLGHLMIAAADMIALTRIETAREVELRAALSAAGQPVGADLTASLSHALTASGATAGTGFLDLAPQVFAAMADQAGQVTLTDLSYAQDSIVMTMEAADLAALQQIEASLQDAGLSVQAGAATTRDGAAEVQMTISRGAP
jgi:general secretion pathway protein L